MARTPAWMKQYERFIDKANCVPSQRKLLERLRANGSLPSEINHFSLKAKVRDHNHRTGTITEVSWTAGYYLNDDECTQVYQEDEIEAVK